MVYLFLAEGFEEIEALATVDILRRGGIGIKTVSVTDSLCVTGAHGISVNADITTDELSLDELEAVILPGGIPGTPNLAASVAVRNTVDFAMKTDRLVCAICAAPSVLGEFGCLSGKKATCYPGFEEKLIGASPTIQPVVRDGNIITSRGAGTAHLFAFEILKTLKNAEILASIKDSMLYE